MARLPPVDGCPAKTEGKATAAAKAAPSQRTGKKGGCPKKKTDVPDAA